MSSSRARYGIMASPPSLRISPETRSGPTDLFFPIALILLLTVLISVVNGSPANVKTVGASRNQLALKGQDKAKQNLVVFRLVLIY